MTTLQEKQAEKQRLGKAYMARKRQEWAELVAREPRITAFKKAIRRQADPAQCLVWLADSWVRTASTETRYAALRIIDAHAGRMARQHGGEALSDPIPPARNVFLAAREMLAVR
jgi:hypothetical protein